MGISWYGFFYSVLTATKTNCSYRSKAIDIKRNRKTYKQKNIQSDKQIIRQKNGQTQNIDNVRNLAHQQFFNIIRTFLEKKI